MTAYRGAITPITRRMLSIVGERELRLHSESHTALQGLCLHNIDVQLHIYIYTVCLLVLYTCLGSVPRESSLSISSEFSRARWSRSAASLADESESMAG